MNTTRLNINSVWCLAALSLLIITDLLSQPATPSNLSVFPRYTASIDLVVQWQDNSNNEDGFRIERREEGVTGWLFWQIITASAGTGQLEWVDITATPDKLWEYRVCATSAALGNSNFTAVSHATSPKQVWPIHDGDHNILHTHGTPLNFSGFRYFHNGIDIGVSGNRVDAGRGGVVTSNSAGAGGTLWLEVDFGAGFETDVYAHVDVDETWGNGDHIAPGERIGTVSTTYFGRDVEADHVHWGDAHMHNLIPFTAASDRDPNQKIPIISDINNDGRDFIVVPANANNHNNPREPAWGEVDFIVDAYDDMAANTNLMAAPFSLGYWIQSGVAGGGNVRNAVTPYELINFDFALHSPQAAHALENAIVYWDFDADIQGINTWQSCLSWILTNTQGTDGATGNVSAAQFWKTDARKGSGTEPNGSDAVMARENQDAQFPDGTYFVHIILEDLVQTHDHIRSVLVDNSRPYVKKVIAYSGLGVVSLAEWSWDAATEQLSIQPAIFEDAATFPAGRTQDITIEVEFSEPMQSASITTLTPQDVSTAALGIIPTLSSTQGEHNRTTWKGIISNLDIADDGSHDGYHKITITGTDLADNTLLQINDRNSMGSNHHNRNAAGNMQGTPGSDNIHGFRIGHMEGEIPVTAIFMKQQAADPVTPVIADKVVEIRQALNSYYDEVSYGDISFAITGIGWYQLNHSLISYYTTPNTPLIDLVQEAITTALTSGADLSASQFVLVVTDEAAARDEWSINGPWPYEIPTDPRRQLMASGVINLASSNAHITNVFGRMVGLIDLFAYPYVSFGRAFVGSWSHMSDKEHEIHVMGWEKWRAGWIDETGTATSKTITHVNKPAPASPIVNQTHTLLPLNNNSDGVKALALEIGDRLHYTAEYRRQDGLDSDLPDEGVLIVKANDYIKQGEGPAIVQNSTLATTDLTEATFITTAGRNTFNDVGSGVNIEVTSMTANQAEIQLNYQVPVNENDVYVSPHDDRWKTVDIWIDAPDLNGNFSANPLDVINSDERPVIGEVNHLHGRVRNQGRADASNFEVHLEIYEPWGSGTTWHSLKIDNVTLLQGQDHASDAYYIITADWTPSPSDHSCVKLSANGVANDVNTENNRTQENISSFVTSPGSPYEPVTSRFRIENPYNETKPVFFRVDGLPPTWSYILTPERLILPPNATGTAQVTVQPNNEAPLCSEELITLTAYTPWEDALTRLGAISLQLELKNPGADIYMDSWAECGQERAIKDCTKVDRKQITYTDEVNYPKNTCIIYSQGCTDPGLPNTEIAVIYTDQDGNKQVHYVMTDENGCFSDMLAVSESGNWEVQSVIEEQNCLAGSSSAKVPVDVSHDIFDDSGILYCVNFGPNFPTGEFNDVYDPGFSLGLGIEKSLNAQLAINLQMGHHQFYSPVQNQHFTQLGFNMKYKYYSSPSRYLFMRVGGGYYVPRYGTNTWGINAGIGIAWIINSKMIINLGFDYYYLDHSLDKYKNAMFLTVPTGITWIF